ncbi:MAG: hypothetical protein HQ522_22660, partial [Bacteroidetes bacterium]|nr:hypothetical protein [Bacteroidota bacterium]
IKPVIRKGKLTTLEKVISKTPFAKEIVAKNPVHFTFQGTSPVDYDIFQPMFPQYVLVSRLAEELVGSEYGVTKLKDTYTIRTDDGNVYYLNTLNTEFYQDEFRMFSSLKGKTENGSFNSVADFRFTRTKEGISYSADIYVLPDRDIVN